MNDTNEILSRLGRIEGKQDATLDNQIRLDKTLAKHDVRLQRVEKGQARVFGIGAGIMAILGFIFGLFKFGGGA